MNPIVVALKIGPFDTLARTLATMIILIDSSRQRCDQESGSDLTEQLEASNKVIVYIIARFSPAASWRMKLH